MGPRAPKPNISDVPMLPVLPLVDPWTHVHGMERRTVDALPADFKVHHELGKGSNNRALRVTWKGHDRILRVPRRHSDTQQRGNAKWEFLHTARASQLGAAPALYDAWYCRHAEGEWPSGLYLVMEYFPHDLERLLEHDSPLVLTHKAALGTAIVRTLEVLAHDRMFVYDLKPSNVVVRLEASATPTVRIIDFGRDFCEWKDASRDDDELDVNTPTIDMLARLVKGNAALVHHILFATMVVQLSATTSRRLYEDRRQHRLCRAERLDINPIVPYAVRLLESMQGCNLRRVRTLLRTDNVRGVLRHYHGRRNAGTRRTLAYARGERC